MPRIRRTPRPLSPEEQEYYRENFLESWHEGGVVCLECGGVYRLLAAHLRPAHEITSWEYKEKWGFNRQTTLAAPGLLEKLRQRALALRFWELLPPDQIQRANSVKQQKAPYPRRPEARLDQADRFRAHAAAGGRPAIGAKKVEDDTFRGLVGEGLGFREIAERARVHRTTVRVRVRALGLVGPGIPPARHLRPQVAERELMALRAAGLSIKAMAARTGLTPGAIDRRLRKLRRRGVAVPPPTGPRPNPKRRVSAEDLLALAQAGLQTREIAHRVGIRPGGVSRRLAVLRRWGLMPPDPSRARREALAGEILALTRTGLGVKEIAARVGLSRMAVRDRLRRLGLIPHPVPRRLKATNADLLALRREGLWLREIAAHTGMTLSAVSARLIRLGRRGVVVPMPARPRPIPTRRASEAQILALVREGLRTSAIAARLGLAASSVTHRLATLRCRGQIPAVPRPRHCPQDELLAMRRAGLSPREMAASTGLTVKALHGRLRRLRQRGVAGPPARRPVRATDGQILTLARQGVRHREIAARVGLSRAHLSHRIGALRRRGLLPSLPADGSRPSTQKVSDERLIALVRAGLGSGEIAGQVGISRSGVRWRLRALRRRRLLPEQAAAPAQGSLAEG